MSLIKKEKSFIGLDIGKYSIKVVEFIIKNNEVILKDFGHTVLSFEAIVDEMIINANEIIEKIKNFIKIYKLKTKSVAIAIPGNSIIIKRLSVSGATYDDIAEQVQNEAPNHIPYNINDVEISFYVEDNDAEQ